MVMLLVSGKVESEGFNEMRRYVFEDTVLSKNELEAVKNKLMEMKLSNTY